MLFVVLPLNNEKPLPILLVISFIPKLNLLLIFFFVDFVVCRSFFFSHINKYLPKIEINFILVILWRSVLRKYGHIYIRLVTRVGFGRNNTRVHFVFDCHRILFNLKCSVGRFLRSISFVQLCTVYLPLVIQRSVNPNPAFGFHFLQ